MQHFGVVHELYSPMPGRFKDYIAVPKPNMYQSIHTTLLGEKGTPFEVQIRTWEMHRIAEYGIAAHWAYKEASYLGRKQTVRVEEDKLAWLRETLEWQKEMEDPQEFYYLFSFFYKYCINVLLFLLLLHQFFVFLVEHVYHS